jgi:hypothetical protein
MQRIGEGRTGSFIHSWYVVTWCASYGTRRIEEVEIARMLLDRCNEAEMWGLTCFLID